MRKKAQVLYCTSKSVIKRKHKRHRQNETIQQLISIRHNFDFHAYTRFVIVIVSMKLLKENKYNRERKLEHTLLSKMAVVNVDEAWSTSNESMSSGLSFDIYSNKNNKSTISIDNDHLKESSSLDVKENEQNCDVEGSAVGNELLQQVDQIAELAFMEGIHEILEDSAIFTTCMSSDNALRHHPADLPFLNESDLVLGIKLGEGGFSNVKACSSFCNKDKNLALSDKKKEYAIKYLKCGRNFKIADIVDNSIDLVKESL